MCLVESYFFVVIVVKEVIVHWSELGVKVICFVDSYPKTDSHKTIGFFTLRSSLFTFVRRTTLAIDSNY